MFKYILGYVIILLGIYYCNDNIIHLLSGNLALVRFIELTLPLSVPSLMYFLQVSKDRYERIEKEKQKESKRKMEEEDKFERSLPFFYVRNGTIFAKSPQKSPILNVKIKIDIIKNDFGILDELSARGEVDSENIIPVGGLIDGDEINLDYLLESNSISKCIRWFVLSAVTITNDIVYFIYLPYLKTGWHFYRRKDGKKPKIVQYIGEERYYELAKFLVAYVAVIGPGFSGETIRNFALKKEYALITDKQLIEIANASEALGLSIQEISLMFKAPDGFSQLEEIISSKRRELDVISEIIRQFCNKQELLESLSPRDLFLLLINSSISPSLEELIRGFNTLSNNQIGILKKVNKNTIPENVQYILCDEKRTINRMRALANVIEKGME